MNEENFGEILDSINQEEICIIDGMQRSNIYFENYEGNENKEIRVEFRGNTNCASS